MLQPVLERHGLAPDELAVVGDRLYTDVELARRTGALGILVLSGETTASHVETATAKPDLIVQDVGELGRVLGA
jgi:NagD protein